MHKHNQEQIEKWMSIPLDLFAKFSADRQTYILQAIEQAGKREWASSRRTELSTMAQQKPAISKDLARGIVIALGCMTFSASSGQIAKQTLSGALVIPASIIGGTIGGILAHEMSSIVFTGILLKNSTSQARRSLYKRQP
jgi:hypothetical protein